MNDFIPLSCIASREDIAALERANLNAWPSARVHWDGDWCLRLTPGARSRRINSVTPFQPQDEHDVAGRLNRICDHFRRHGKTPTFRWTPLFPAALMDRLQADRWRMASETIVMTRPISITANRSEDPSQSGMHQGGLAEWVRKLTDINRSAIADAVALRSTLANVVPAAKRLLIETDDGTPVAAGFCVADGAYLGLFLVYVSALNRRQGHAQALLAAALEFGEQNGAETAWLQVEADNPAALALYAAAGFQERYRYFYMQPDLGA